MKVRKAIADIGGMMPEEMPTPKKSLKELEKEKNNWITKKSGRNKIKFESISDVKLDNNYLE